MQTMLVHALDPNRHEAPPEDNIVVLAPATWADYQRLLEIRGEKAAPSISYLRGSLEIVSPSASHEKTKSILGRLIEVYCLERNIEFLTLGAWTLEDKAAERGVEPDECYLFGDRREATRPDLAIEVVWTSGGLNKPEIYRVLGVREVWFWRRGTITVHVLREGTYVESAASDALPGIDVDQLASFVDRPTTSAAMRDYREALRVRVPHKTVGE